MPMLAQGGMIAVNLAQEVVEESGPTCLGCPMGLLPRSLVLALTSTTESRAEPSSQWPVDEDYWLGHCHGFRVDGPGGRLGVVEHVIYGSRVDRPDAVAVRLGLRRSRTVTVPVTDVTQVCPAHARLILGREAGTARKRGGWLHPRSWRARPATGGEAG